MVRSALVPGVIRDQTSGILRGGPGRNLAAIPLSLRWGAWFPAAYRAVGPTVRLPVAAHKNPRTIMRLSLRFLVPLLLAIGAFAYLAVPLADTLMQRWFVRDLDMRSSLIAATVQEPLSNLIVAGSTPAIVAFFNRMLRDDRLYAVAVCLGAKGEPVATANFPRGIDCSNLVAYADAGEHVLHSAKGPLHIAVRDVDADVTPDARLILVHDMSFVERRSEETRRYLFYFFIALGACIALITVVIAQLSWRGWVDGLRALLRGEGILRPAARSTAPELRPIARDLRELIRDLERQYRPLDGSQRIWDQEALRATLRSELHGNDVIVVSNREPYIHVRTDEGIRIQRPASGLVTALEPVMRACSGTWIAHGSGSADRETVDGNDRVAVPPEHPALPDPAHLALEGGGGRLLRRIRERGPVAALPYRSRPPDVPLQRFRVLPQRERAVRRGGRRGVEDERPDRAGAGLPLRAPAADDSRPPPRCDDHYVLAHSMAQSRGVRDLPVAHRAPGRPAREQHPRLPHAVPLQQFRRHGRPPARGARRPRILHRVVPRAVDDRPPLSDFDRMAAGGARDREERPGGAQSGARAPAPAARPPAGRRDRPARLHQGHHRALQRRRPSAGAAARMGRPLLVRPDRGAVAQQHRRLPRLRGARSRAG